jgi:hypothetical protein
MLSLHSFPFPGQEAVKNRVVGFPRECRDQSQDTMHVGMDFEIDTQEIIRILRAIIPWRLKIGDARLFDVIKKRWIIDKKPGNTTVRHFLTLTEAVMRHPSLP